MSTARVTPSMSQEKNVLHAHYVSASGILALWNRSVRPRVRWPEEEFYVSERGLPLVMPCCEFWNQDLLPRTCG